MQNKQHKYNHAISIKGKELLMVQMSLPNFIKEYGIPRSSLERLIYSKEFPAYKIKGRWYIDIAKYEKWREIEHRRNVKVAF
jgi:hypothetical protein